MKTDKKNDDTYLQIVKDIVLSHIDKEKVFVILFGSRALDNYRSKADIDIGLITKNTPLDRTIHRVINAIDESIVPYKVDIIDFKQTDDDFKKVALKNVIVWNKPKNFQINLPL